MDLAAAADVVEGARDLARATDDPRLTPPPLKDCRQDIIASAVTGPAAGFGETEFYPSLPLKSAVLAYRIINGHPCPDGNKRLALLLADAFLELNGHEIEASAEEIDHVFRSVARSRPDQYEETLEIFTNWFDAVTWPTAGEERR